MELLLKHVACLIILIIAVAALFFFALSEGPSYRVAKNLFSEIKNQDQKPINAKIYFFSIIGHVGTRAIFSKSTTFYNINSRPLNSNIAAAVAVAALFVLVSFVTTATTGRSLIRSLIRSGSCLPCGEHVIPASCAPVAAAVSCCLTSRRQQARSRFAGTQLAEVLVSCSPRGYLLVRRRVGHVPRHATVRACPCVLVCVSGEIAVPVL